MPILRKDQLAATLSDRRMLATPLVVTCVDSFGTEFFEWEPDTFDLEIKRLAGIEMPDANRDKIWALVTAISTNLFYVSLESFIPICNALNDSEADFDDYDPVTAGEAAWGIVEVGLNDPAPSGETPGSRFSHEVRRYVAITLKTEGVSTPPRIFADVPEYDRDPEEETGIVIGPDEALLQMHTQQQKEAQEDIEDYVMERLNLLFDQLRGLPLEHGQLAGLDQLLPAIQATLRGGPMPETAAPAPASVL